jgi:hypothetical protein
MEFGVGGHDPAVDPAAGAVRVGASSDHPLEVGVNPNLIATARALQ